MSLTLRALSFPDRILIAGAVAAAVILKAATIIAYAPQALGDNYSFVEAADYMLSGPEWLADAQLGNIWPATLWRPIGYSLVIAGSKLLFGAVWPYAVCTLQGLLSLTAGLLLIRLCLTAGLGVVPATFVFMLYQLSVPLSTDALIMEDALTGFLGMTALLVILQPLARGAAPTGAAFFAAGCLAAASFLIRDVYHFVMPVFAGIVLFIFAVQGRWKKGVVAAVALAAPVFILASGLQVWNEHRTGSRITTTAGQTAYLYAVLRAAKHDPGLIDGPTQIEAVLRESNRTFDYVDTKRANQILFERLGMNSIEQARAAETLFWQGLGTHPAAYLKAAMERFRFVQQATLFGSGLTRLDDLHWWSGGATEEGYRTGWRRDALEFFNSRQIKDLTPTVFVNLALRKTSEFASIILFVVFLTGTPLFWLQRRRGSDAPAANAAIVAWGCYGLWVSLYLLVSFEVRYLSPVIGPALFATGVLFLAGSRRFRERAWPLLRVRFKKAGGV